MTFQYDLFLSHALEDKAAFVRPLARILSNVSLKVWYDEDVLVAGDSLLEEISAGLSKSKFGVVVFSPSFFTKSWAGFELKGLVSLLLANKGRIVPVWLNVTADQIRERWPSLVDLVAIRTNGEDIDRVALEIVKTVHPALHRSLYDLAKLRSVSLSKLRIEMVNPHELKPGPILHHKFDEETMIRMQNLFFCARTDLQVF